jgi:hypothetical protein
MPASPGPLPFDLVHVVASSLDVSDYVHLSIVNKRYHELLQNESMASKALQVCPLRLSSTETKSERSSKQCFTLEKANRCGTTPAGNCPVAMQ